MLSFYREDDDANYYGIEIIRTVILVIISQCRAYGGVYAEQSRPTAECVRSGGAGVVSLIVRRTTN